MNVLIASKETETLARLQRALEPLGFVTRTCSNGSEAWQILQKTQIHLLLADSELPHLDGAELCRRVRARNRLLYTYILLFTRDSKTTQNGAWLQAEADGFLLDPNDPLELSARLEVARRQIGLHAKQRELSQEVETLRSDLQDQNARFDQMVNNLGAANKRFTELFQGLPVACYSYDEQGFIHEWNRAAVELTGFQPYEAFGQPIWEIFRAKNARDQKRNILEKQEEICRIFAGESLVGREIAAYRRDGKRLHVLANTFPIFLPNGQITGAISANIDITDRKTLDRRLAEQLDIANMLNSALDTQRQQLEAANARLEALAITDGLTGLKNHRAFQDQLESEFQRAMRSQSPLSLLLIDVDDFKLYNDTFGHLAGDEVLKQLARLLQKSTRVYDFVARYGGEEFVIILPDTDSRGALRLAERYRSRIDSAQWVGRPVTASFGVASLTPAMPDRKHLIAEADAALYASKQNGRNRVTHYSALSLVPVKATQKTLARA